jgi:hypothetical protein
MHHPVQKVEGAVAGGSPPRIRGVIAAGRVRYCPMMTTPFGLWAFLSVAGLQKVSASGYEPGMIRTLPPG